MDLSILSACFSCLILLPTTTTHYHQLIYIYLFQVCIANPPESLTSAGCAPQFPPGCDCDPAADDPNSSCPANSQCVQCKCLPQGCDCDPSAEDPNSFCPAEEICKVGSFVISFLGHIFHFIIAIIGLYMPTSLPPWL